jgi:hypothetical protein
VADLVGSLAWENEERKPTARGREEDQGEDDFEQSTKGEK